MTAEPVFAQTGATTPIIPGFGVRYETIPTYTEPSYTVDPLTGEAVLLNEGYTELYRTVWISVSGQPFSDYTDVHGNNIQLFYDVRFKPYDSDSWQVLPENVRFTQKEDMDGAGIVLAFKGLKGEETGVPALTYVSGGQIDFKIRAQIGYYTADNVFVGQSSGWSDIQTLTIPNDNQTSTPTVSPSEGTSTNPLADDFIGLNWVEVAILVVLVVIAVLLVFVVVFLRRRSTAAPR